jgi:hypothetical protein
MKCLKLLEVIYAKNVACEVQKIGNERCCGCKVYEQDCLMMDEHETWQMHGLNAIERVNNTSSTWNEFMAAIKILNVENHEDFIQHMICLQQCLFNFGGNLRGNFSGFQAILNYL